MDNNNINYYTIEEMHNIYDKERIINTFKLKDLESKLKYYKELSPKQIETYKEDLKKYKEELALDNTSVKIKAIKNKINNTNSGIENLKIINKELNECYEAFDLLNETIEALKKMIKDGNEYNISMETIIKCEKYIESENNIDKYISNIKNLNANICYEIINSNLEYIEKQKNNLSDPKYNLQERETAQKEIQKYSKKIENIYTILNDKNILEKEINLPIQNQEIQNQEIQKKKEEIINTFKLKSINPIEYSKKFYIGDIEEYEKNLEKYEGDLKKLKSEKKLKKIVCHNYETQKSKLDQGINNLKEKTKNIYEKNNELEKFLELKNNTKTEEEILKIESSKLQIEINKDICHDYEAKKSELEQGINNLKGEITKLDQEITKLDQEIKLSEEFISELKKIENIKIIPNQKEDFFRHHSYNRYFRENLKKTRKTTMEGNFLTNSNQEQQK